MLESLLLLLLLLSSHTLVLASDSTICYDARVEKRTVNTTFLQPVTEEVAEFCWSWSFSCTRKITHFVTKWREETVSRVRNRRTCCPGFREEVRENSTVSGLACLPSCPLPCVHGTCSAPSTCSCHEGYAGPQCREPGCPGGNWGEDCRLKCFCEHGGTCHAVSGECSCTPGYSGALCQRPCRNNTFGEDCEGQCSCPPGHNCHHVSGECVQCRPNTWGRACGQKCTCSSPGTALCSSQDGRCFCEANYFGVNCDQHCPFGFYDDICLSAPLNSSCSCPSDLFSCDPRLGCVCPLGQHCGIETDSQVELGLLQPPATPSTLHLALAASGFLLLTVLLCLCLFLSYRRSLARLKRYHADPQGQTNRGLDTGEGGEDLQPEPLPPQPRLTTADTDNNLVVFARRAPALENPLYNYTVNYIKPEKTSNLDRAREANMEEKKVVEEEDVYVYHEPAELRNDLMAALEEEGHYDHLNYTRTVNELSPNYIKLNNK